MYSGWFINSSSSSEAYYSQVCFICTKTELWYKFLLCRVYLTCNLRGLCTVPDLSVYFTAEIWVLIAAMLVHVPICGAVLLAADRLKSGGRICNVSNYQHHPKWHYITSFCGPDPSKTFHFRNFDSWNFHFQPPAVIHSTSNLCLNFANVWNALPASVFPAYSSNYTYSLKPSKIQGEQAFSSKHSHPRPHRIAYHQAWLLSSARLSAK